MSVKSEKLPQLIHYLRPFVTKERWDTLNKVLDKRTRYLTLVLEDLYQPHNASAVLRSCDCFGIQDVHIIENKNEFDPNTGVTIGADQWVSVHKYHTIGQDNTSECYQKLKAKGYSIVATTPHKNDAAIDEIALDQKLALVFGAEYTGLSDYALEHADGYAKIPMVGFSESFNISVAVAICLYELSTRLRKEEGVDWKMGDIDKRELRFQWLKNSIRAADNLVDQFLAENSESDEKPHKN